MIYYASAGISSGDGSTGGVGDVPPSTGSSVLPP